MLEEDSFYYKFFDPRIKTPQKFTDCNCEIVKVEDGNCIVKACESHERSIKSGSVKHISFGPATPLIKIKNPLKSLFDKLGHEYRDHEEFKPIFDLLQEQSEKAELYDALQEKCQSPVFEYIAILEHKIKKTEELYSFIKSAAGVDVSKKWLETQFKSFLEDQS